jgi:tetratricopeptide (TPR) repeat protein
MALKIAREIGQRSGEAYALYQLGLYLSAQGEYRRALDSLQQSLLIAEELEHRQWMIAAHWATGALYLDLLSPLIAQHHLKQALYYGVQWGYSRSDNGAAHGQVRAGRTCACPW